MLICLDKLYRKFNLNIKGVLHIGAHKCEEQWRYIKYVSNDKIIWIEANPSLVNFIKQTRPELHIHHAIVSDKDGDEVTLNISNNGESSSILDLEYHKIAHPHIHYIGNFTGKTTTIKTFYEQNSIEKDSLNFLNIDIQGAELLALKGMGDLLNNFDYLYLEVNEKELYKNCAMMSEIDEYVSQYEFKRVETDMTEYGWGDAFYIKKN